MENLLQPYEGSAPYVFVSYSHKDSDRVFPILQRLQAEGLRFWYDKGIEWGSKWDNYIANRVRNCDCVIAFISSNFTNSPHCEDEISHAKTCRKNFLPIYLEPIQLEEGMEMRLGRYQAAHFFKYSASEIENFYSQLLKSKFLASCYETQDNIFSKKSANVLKNQSKNKADDLHSTLLNFDDYTTCYKINTDPFSNFDNPTTYCEITADPFSNFDDSTTYYEIKTDSSQNKKVRISHTTRYVSDEKVVPVIFMLDTSGSMTGNPIKILKRSIKNMLKILSDYSEISKWDTDIGLSKTYTIYKIAIITFDSGARITMNYTDVEKIKDLPELNTGGGTEFGVALKLAKNMIDDPTVTLENWQYPNVILVTDGAPAAGYPKTLHSFVTDGYSAYCKRYAIGIGEIVDKEVLKQFATNPILIQSALELEQAFHVIANSMTSGRLYL